MDFIMDYVTGFFMEYVRGIPAFIIGALFVCIIVRFVYINVSMSIARSIVTTHPTEENAMRAYKLLSAKLGVSINNHPKDWAKYKDMFYKINGSSDIPTELKQKIKDRLIKKGLYIQNMRVIDNYKKGSII